MEAIADGLEVSSGGESPSHANISRSKRPGDAWGRLEGDHNA
jgi:hypothetical protein